MTFSLYCLILDEESIPDIHVFESQLSEHFSKTNWLHYESTFEEEPFDPLKLTLRLSWGPWWVFVFYDAGESVKSDSEFISKFAPSNSRKMIASIDRRITVLFASDESLEYTNHIIAISDYLESRRDLIVFNPGNNKFTSQIN